MEIVGGAYREICYMPPWNALFGSGVRAAAAVSNLASEINLHCLVEQSEAPNLSFLHQLGVRVSPIPRRTPIVFVYFHPLSRPHIEPSPSVLQQESNLLVTGDTVLRFGLLEADAVVRSEHAVYDPQTSVNPALFRANGSQAKRLSLVLNELELRALSGATTLSQGAELLMRVDDAQVVVVKMGIKGAMVFDRHGKRTHVPAYSSDRVFKIGTGDVFSAGFAYHWGERGKDPVTAADEASRMVAAYCGSGALPVPPEPFNATALPSGEPGVVKLVGEVRTIGERYTMEEARFVLRDFGVRVTSPSLGDMDKTEPSSILVVQDVLDISALEKLESSGNDTTPVIVLVQSLSDTEMKPQLSSTTRVVRDFTTAVYFAAWAAIDVVNTSELDSKQGCE